jgi:hypothetical protein
MKNFWAFISFWTGITIGRCIATKQKAAHMFSTWHSHNAEALTQPPKQNINMHAKRDKNRK